MGKLQMSASEVPRKLHSVKTFQFIIVGLEDLSPAEAVNLAQHICEIFESHDAEVSSISSFLVIGNFGVLWSKDSASARLALVSDLLEKQGHMIRIAHGQCTSVAGILGSRLRLRFEGLIPGFHEIRAQLSQTPFGTAFEVPEPAPKP
jgi:hypothetical protein